MLALRNLGPFAVFSIFCMGLLLSSSISFAQEPEESAREAVERDLRAVDERDATQDDRLDSTISFERVLAAPDDVQLNLAYAREQIAAGDLKEGSATLERVLLLNPELGQVRVLYGLVLYRLGLLDRARFELETALKNGDLSTTVRTEAEVYLKKIKRQLRTTHGSLIVTTGVEWDQNRNQAPSSGQILFVDIPLPAGARNGDLAYITSVQGNISHDLGFQDGHTLNGEAAYYRSNKIEVDSLDLDAVTAAFGGTWYSGRMSVTPRLRAGQFWLDDNDYLRTLGGEVEVIMRWRQDLNLHLVVRGEDEDFRVVPNFLAAALRSGRRISTRAGVTWRVSPTQSIRVEGLYMDKKGETGFESYDRYGGYAQYSRLYRRGAFTQIGLWAENSDYDASDSSFVSVTERSEWLYRARVTAGAPLSFFAPGLSMPKAVSDINLIAQYEYETVDSNITNFDYNTHKVSLLLSKRIAF